MTADPNKLTQADKELLGIKDSPQKIPPGYVSKTITKPVSPRDLIGRTHDVDQRHVDQMIKDINKVMRDTKVTAGRRLKVDFALSVLCDRGAYRRNAPRVIPLVEKAFAEAGFKGVQINVRTVTDHDQGQRSGDVWSISLQIPQDLESIPYEDDLVI